MVKQPAKTKEIFSRRRIHNLLITHSLPNNLQNIFPSIPNSYNRHNSQHTRTNFPKRITHTINLHHPQLLNNYNTQNKLFSNLINVTVTQISCFYLYPRALNLRSKSSDSRSARCFLIRKMIYSVGLL